MNAKELVRRWKDRQTQILGMLPEAIRTEFHELTVSIRRAECEFAESKKATSDNGRSTQTAPPPIGPEDIGKVLERMSQRVPLETRKQQVIQCLRDHGPMPRGEILRVVSIPNGSLSNVLADQDVFEQDESSLWKLKEKDAQ